MKYQTKTINHSDGQANDDGMPGKYMIKNNTLNTIAIIPTALPFLIR